MPAAGPNVSHLTHNRQEMNPQKFCVELFHKNLARNMCCGLPCPAPPAPQPSPDTPPPSPDFCKHGPRNDAARQCGGPGCRHETFKEFYVEKHFFPRKPLPPKKKPAESATTPDGDDDGDDLSIKCWRPQQFWYRIRIVPDPRTGKLRRMSLYAVIHELVLMHQERYSLETCWLTITKQFSAVWRSMGCLPLDHFDLIDNDESHNQKVCDTVEAMHSHFKRDKPVGSMLLYAYSTGKRPPQTRGDRRHYSLENEVIVGDQILTITQIMHRCVKLAGTTRVSASRDGHDFKQAALNFIPYWRDCVLPQYPEIEALEKKDPIFPMDDITKLKNAICSQYGNTYFKEDARAQRASSEKRHPDYDTLFFRMQDRLCPGQDPEATTPNRNTVEMHHRVMWREKVLPPVANKVGRRWVVKLNNKARPQMLMDIFGDIIRGKTRLPNGFGDDQIKLAKLKKFRGEPMKNHYLRGAEMIHKWWPLLCDKYPELNLPRKRWHDDGCNKDGINPDTLVYGRVRVIMMIRSRPFTDLTPKPVRKAGKKISKS